MKTDYERITEKLEAVGASCLQSVWNFKIGDLEARADFWNVNGQGIIVVSHHSGETTGKCGLYALVGNDGDPIEEDLDFIETLSEEDAEIDADNKN